MVLRTNSDCGHTVYIDKNNDLHIEYLDGVVGDCDITVICRGEEGSRYPRLCVQAELLHVGECLIRVDMHHLTVIEGYENKVKQTGMRELQLANPRFRLSYTDSRYIQQTGI